MDVKYINPFLSSFTSILPQLGVVNIRKGSISLKDNAIESPGVVIIVGILGDIRGNIIYATSTRCAKRIASSMMMGMPVHDFNDLAQSAISELANMLTATAATNFSNEDINIDISTPTLVYGNFTANAASDKVLCVQMIVDEMPFDINISIESK